MTEVKSISTVTPETPTPSSSSATGPNYSWWVQPSQVLASAKCSMELDGGRLTITQFTSTASPQLVLDALIEATQGDSERAKALFRQWQTHYVAVNLDVPSLTTDKEFAFPDHAYYEADGSNLSFQRIRNISDPSDIIDEFGYKIYDMLTKREPVVIDCGGDGTQGAQD